MVRHTRADWRTDPVRYGGQRPMGCWSCAGAARIADNARAPGPVLRSLSSRGPWDAGAAR
eukprot:4249756-Lingulodinium_polyedra.AAC.1